MSDNSATITGFLEARIAEDEALARAATPSPWTLYNRGVGWEIPELPEPHDGLTFIKADAHYVAHNHPARVLSECEAKRVVIGNANYTALNALAAVYSDHPDYREDWSQ
jgi:hypothetical protein